MYRLTPKNNKRTYIVLRYYAMQRKGNRNLLIHTEIYEK